MKKIFKIIKRIIISSFLLYGYNLMISPIGAVIPINFITILLITILGFPALFALIFILIFVF